MCRLYECCDKMLKANKKKVVNKVKEYKNVWQQAWGLMFSRRIKNECLIFVFKKPRIVSLHMAFVFFAIDVLYLNAKKEVVEIKRNFKPFTAFVPVEKAKYVIELPNNSTKKVKLKDKISW